MDVMGRISVLVIFQQCTCFKNHYVEFEIGLKKLTMTNWLKEISVTDLLTDPKCKKAFNKGALLT